MKERDIQTVFRDTNEKLGIFELKLCKGTSIPFDAVKDHQRTALSLISGEMGLFYKIADSPIFTGTKMRFATLKPFDCFRLANIPAYVVICFYVPRKYKRFYYIEIDRFLDEAENSARKSLTMDRAAEIAAHEMEV
jgi:penicillin-binding protein-related factor A (putative recombinase)